MQAYKTHKRQHLICATRKFCVYDETNLSQEEAISSKTIVATKIRSQQLVAKYVRAKKKVAITLLQKFAAGHDPW